MFLRFFFFFSLLTLIYALDTYNPPLQVHLAVTGDPTEMVVSWMTSLPTSESIVRVYGREPREGYFNKFSGEQFTYLPSAGWVHHVKITGLIPSKEYHYECGSSEGGFTGRYSFTTPPNYGTHGNRTFIMYGDMGIFQYSYPTVKHVTSLVLSDDIDIDLIYHAGDMGYGNDRPAEFYELSWNLFFYQMDLVMQRTPYMVCPGNHEQSCSSKSCEFYSSNFTVYNARFRMPGVESGSNTNMWFSFDYDNVHFVSISTETDYPNCPYPADTFGDQISWLEADLAKASLNPNIDWIFVTGHRPIYSSVSGKSTNGKPSGDSENVQKAFEDLFYQYGVDIYFDGHVHGYERSYPVYRSKVQGNNTINYYQNPSATVYIVNGNAGNIEGFYDSWNEEIPSWSAKRYWPHPEHGYGILQTYGSSQARWTWYKNLGEPVDNNYFDWFVIDKTGSHSNPAPPSPWGTN